MFVHWCDTTVIKAEDKNTTHVVTRAEAANVAIAAYNSP